MVETLNHRKIYMYQQLDNAMQVRLDENNKKTLFLRNNK